MMVTRRLGKRRHLAVDCLGSSNTADIFAASTLRADTESKRVESSQKMMLLSQALKRYKTLDIMGDMAEEEDDGSYCSDSQCCLTSWLLLLPLLTIISHSSFRFSLRQFSRFVRHIGRCQIQSTQATLRHSSDHHQVSTRPCARTSAEEIQAPIRNGSLRQGGGHSACENASDTIRSMERGL